MLPIVNKLLVDKEVLSKPPYALVLLPSIELCHQVSSKLTKFTVIAWRFIGCSAQRDAPQTFAWLLEFFKGFFQSILAAETKKNYCKHFSQLKTKFEFGIHWQFTITVEPCLLVTLLILRSPSSCYYGHSFCPTEALVHYLKEHPVNVTTPLRWSTATF